MRLVKGAYDEPPSVAHVQKDDVDAAYARCLGVLMRGGGYPMVGSHDPRMVALAQRLAGRHGQRQRRATLAVSAGAACVLLARALLG